ISTTALLTIRPAPLVVTANSTQMIYGGPVPAFTANYTGFTNGDTVSVLNGSPSLTTTATSSSPQGTYAITASLGTLAAANYTFTLVPGTLTVNAATLTVTAQSTSRTYGATNPTFTAFITGFVNGDTLSVVSGSASLSTTATQASGVGTYPISSTLGTLASVNYIFTFVNGLLTITPATASVTPNAASKTYGAVDPVLTGTLTGFLAADNVTATYSRAAGETVSGGPYTISAALSPAGVLGNYSITANTALFTINQAPSSTTFTSSLNPSVFGTSVTFTATVSSS